MMLSYSARRFFIKSPKAGDNADGAEKAHSVTHFEVIFLIALQLLLFVAYFSWCELPEAAYFSSFIALEVFKNGSLVVITVINLLVGVLFFRNLTWATIDPTNGARVFVSVVAVTIMWQFATYDYNFYYDQAHYLDRLLLIILGVLIYWHPSFAPLFTIFSIVVASQLHYPLPEAAWLWADKKILFDALILFNAFLLLAVFRGTISHTFLYVVLCLTGAIYFEAAVSKLSLGPTYYSWLVHNKLSNLLVSSYVQGWLAFLDVANVTRLAQYMSTIDIPMAIVTLSIELSALFILWSKNVSRLALTCLIFLHIGIGVASGIFFWMWCVYDAALISFICKAQSAGDCRIYDRKLFVLSIAIILMSPLYFRPIHFAWFDTTLSNFFTIYGTGQSGTTYKLDPRFFAPYDITFAQSRLYYLTQERILVGTYGTSQSHSLAELLEGSSPSEIRSLKERYGVNFYNERFTASFRTFVRRYVGNAQRRGTKFIAINSLAPPYHFGSFSGKDLYDFQEKLRTVHVYYEEHFFTGQRIVALQKELVMEVPIDQLAP
jgi:hypothetical protein